MNELWPKYFRQAVLKHFNGTGIYTFHVGKKRETNHPEWIEVRDDGPWGEKFPSSYRFEYEINILIGIIDPENIFRMEEIGGQILKLLATDIPVSDGIQEIGCLRPIYNRIRKLQFNKFGIIDTSIEAEQATAEQRYEIYIEGS